MSIATNTTEGVTILQNTHFTEAPALEQEFTQIADDARLQRTVRSLEANGIHALIVQNGEEARRKFFELVPEGAEILLAASVTLETLGIQEEIEKSGRYDAVRPKRMALDRATQGREIRKLGGAPDYAAGSVHAVTEGGQVIIASNGGSQLGPYASGAGKVIWVVGAQKIVTDFEAGMRRVYEHSLPLEMERARQAYNIRSNVSKMLVINKEVQPNRITMIIVKESLGF
ncbi:MAG TPA: LUD domain-containing protein [Anaerolineales bacterium]